MIQRSDEDNKEENKPQQEVTPVPQQNNQMNLLMQQLQQTYNHGCLGALAADRYAPKLSKIIQPQKLSQEMNENDLERFKQHLPEGQQSLQDLKENLSSMEFLQALKTFDSLVWSDELKNLTISLGIFDQDIFNNTKDRKLISYRSIGKNV